MLRLVYVIIVSSPLIIYYVCRCRYVARHRDRYSEEERYYIAKKMVTMMKVNGRIRTKVYGTENLPAEGGYVMYPNHQGKYDILGVMWGHKKPCSFVIDADSSKMVLANEFTMLLEGFRLDKNDFRSQVKTILGVAKQVADGKRFIVFPEGQYNTAENVKGNEMVDFLPGAFKCSVKSKSPIVPVALIDSYKVYGVNSLKKVTTQVHFLEPIMYEDYKYMNTAEIADMVKGLIADAIEENTQACCR